MNKISKGRTALVMVFAIPFLYPFVIAVFMAIEPKKEYVNNPAALPHSVTFGLLKQVWKEQRLGPGIVNSVISTAVGAVVVVAASSTAAFWLSRRNSLASRSVMGVILSGWLFPGVVWIIPFFVLISRVHLTNNLIVLGVVYGATNVPFGVYLLYHAIKQVAPHEVLEACRLDGCNQLQEFVRIVVPLLRPAIATLTALAVVWSWGDFLIGLIMLNDQSKFPVTLAAASIANKNNVNSQEQAGAAVIALLPMLLIFLVAQRAIVRGFVSGATRE